MSDLTLKLIEIGIPLVVTAAFVALAYAASYLRGRAANIRNEELRMATWDVIDRARDAAHRAVKATAQTYVDDLKASKADGKLTPQEAAEARRRAQEHFAKQLGIEGLVVLESAVGDVQRWFETHLESVVHDLGKR